MYGILIYDNVEPIDIGATFGVLSMARRIAPDLQFTSVAGKAGEITCAGGVRMWADHGVEDCPEFEDLVVTGGPGWVEASEDPAILDYLANTSARLTSICTGAMILAAAGRLEGRTVTTKREVFAGETSPSTLLPESASFTSATLVDDGEIVTGGGVSLGLDTMFYCLARSHGKAVAEETARVMEYQRALHVNEAALPYVGTAP